MIVNLSNAPWRYKMNGAVRHAMVRGIPGFGPPKVVLTEYPKSGGTWLCQMIAEYLGIPHPRNRPPPRRRCVVQGHYFDVSHCNDTIVMWRDGRDVMVSYYYYALLERPTTRRRWTIGHRQRLGINGADDVLDVGRYLPRFIEYCFTQGLPRGMTWVNFTDAWKERTGYVEARYEAMITEPRSELVRILRAISASEIDSARLDASIAKYAFEAVAGRKSGEEDAHSRVRKGIVGDWKGKFTREAREVFDHYAGQTLIDLGYEPDHRWVDA